MTPTQLFHSDDTEGAMRFMAEHPFAVLAVNGEHGPVTAMVPLVVDDTGTALLGHVAKANPFWKAAQDSEAKAVALFKGHDAYVTPSSYPSKQEHGRVVPTWNYMALQVRGNISIETDASAIGPMLKTLTNKMETGRDMPWKVSDAPDDYIEKLSRGIVGFTLDIDDITYVKKLSQNKDAGDRGGVVQMFETSDDISENILAKEMKQDN